MLTIAAANAMLALLCRNDNWANVGDATGLRGSTTPGNLYLSACTAFPGYTPAGGQGEQEATYTGYARPAIVRSSSGWGTPSGGSISPVADSTFGIRSDNGANQLLYYWILGTASSGSGNALLAGFFGDATFGMRAFASDDVTTEAIKVAAHGLATDDRVAFFAGPNGSLPAGITEGTVYFVRSGSTTDTFTVATTSGGAAVNVTAMGVGLVAKIKPLTVAQTSEPKLSSSTVLHLI